MSEHFEKVTKGRYYAMQKRVRKTRYVTHLPFTLTQYREWVRERLGGDERGHQQCEYCGAFVSLETMITEHRVPLAQGGDAYFSNLAVSCDPCNQQKGTLRPIAFAALRKLAADRTLFTPVDRDNLLGRLQIAMKLSAKVQAIHRRGSQTVRLNPAPRVREPRSA